MLVSELITQIRKTLQDADADYWTDAELLEYYNNGIRVISSERLEETTTTDVALTTDTYQYTVNGVLRYISAIDSNNIERPLYPDDNSGEHDVYGIVVEEYNRIYVNTPITGVTVTIKHIALPDDQETTDTVRMGDETMLKYYVLSRAYEKEQDTENFQKAQYFLMQFQALSRSAMKHDRQGYRKQMQLTQSYFY